jgi:hypothetical protein
LTVALEQRSVRYILVPDGSTLFFETVGTKKGFTISAELRSAGPVLKSWQHDKLVAAEQKHVLRSPKNYDLIVDVVFTGTETVDVDVKTRIIRLDGTQHSVTKALSFSGKSPTRQSGTAQIVTRKS